MSFGMIVAAGAAFSQYTCDVMSYGVLEPPRIHGAVLRLDDRGDETDLAFTTMGMPSLSGQRRSIKPWIDSAGLRRLWPVSIKTEAGDTIELDLVGTLSTHGGTNSALLIRQGGDFTVGNLAENNESFVAVGMCSFKRDVAK